MSSSILLIGPKISNDSIGGVTVLFSLLLNDLNVSDVKYDLFDSNSKNYSSRTEMYLKCLIKILNPFKYRNISLHGTANDYLYFSIPLLFSKFFLFKKYSLRKFAGNFDSYFDSLSPMKRFFVASLLKRSKVNFFETKKLVRFFSDYNKETYWFPNVRSETNISSCAYDKGCFKLVFISQLMKEKGVIEAANVVELLARCGDFSLDIYGPAVDVNVEDLIKNRKVNYKGVLEAEDVQTTMSNYHALIFPTYYKGEGYPGVIIEAFSVGLPIITTNWLAISEMFSSNEMLVDACELDLIKDKVIEIKERHGFFKTHSEMNFSKFNSSYYTENFTRLAI